MNRTAKPIAGRYRAAGISTVYLMLLLPLTTVDPLRSQQPTAPTAETYVIGVGDLLTVSVWKNPELSAQVPVRPDGMITLPLVGEVEVAGLRPDQVREILNESYAAFVTAPTISVVVNEINSMKIYIVGEVARSGTYDLVQPLRLMQALALAGGVTEYAKKDELLVLRQQSEGEQRLVVSIKAIANGKKPSDNIKLMPGDTIVVP